MTPVVVNIIFDFICIIIGSFLGWFIGIFLDKVVFRKLCCLFGKHKFIYTPIMESFEKGFIVKETCERCGLVEYAE